MRSQGTYDPPSGQTYPQPGPGQGGQAYGVDPDIVVQERPFVVGFLLTIVTLGIWPYVWHWMSHDETCRQMGIENKAKPIWIAYIVVTITSVALGWILPDTGQVVRDLDPDQVTGLAALLGIWSMVSGLLVISSIVLFIIFVVKQWETVTAAKKQMGLQMRGSTATFFLLYYGSFGIVILFFWLIIPIIAPLVMIPMAYHLLQENHNDIARALKHGQVDRVAYRPGGHGWQGAPVAPPRPGPVPIVPTGVHAQPTPYAPYPPQPPGAPEEHGGMPSTSWDAPSHPPYAHPVADRGRPTPYGDDPHAPAPRTEGFSIQDRGAHPAAEFVEQHFQCPRCHAHVAARGPAGEDVTIRCDRCGEGGSVRLPRSA